MNETKLLITGDWHWTKHNPKARTDIYFESLKLKFKEVLNIANEQDCEAIISTGDIFDTPGVSLSTIRELIILLAENNIKNIPILAVAGNHDEYGNNIQSLQRTPYGILVSFGLIHDLHNEYFYGDNYFVNGTGYDSKFVDKNMNYYLSKTPAGYEGDINIKVTHGMLLEKSPGYEIRHTLMSDIAYHNKEDKIPDVLINGHIHDCQGIHKINNTLFINPGSIGRIKATEENINRIPQVALLTIPEDGEPYAELIPLKSAKPGHEVLSREHIIEEKKRKEMTKEFLTLLAEEGDRNYQDLEQIVKGIGERKNIPPNVVNEALKRLEEAREEGHNERRAG